MTGSLDPPPELELRGRPRPIRRLNKRTLMIGAAIVVLLIAGATIVALNPPRLAAPQNSPELYNTERKQTAEGLAKLPKSYGDIPQLGPPAPGDIGRALVESEKRPGSAPPAHDALPAEPGRGGGTGGAHPPGPHRTAGARVRPVLPAVGKAKPPHAIRAGRE